MTGEKSINEILAEFPYSARPDQEQKLASILLNFPDNTQDTLKKVDVSRPTFYDIRNSYEQLSHGEKQKLVQHLAQNLDQVEPVEA